MVELRNLVEEVEAVSEVLQHFAGVVVLCWLGHLQSLDRDMDVRVLCSELVTDTPTSCLLARCNSLALSCRRTISSKSYL